MGRATRAVGVGLFVLFVSGIALRPVLSNPAFAAALRDGLTGWQALVFVPLLVLTLLVTALRVRPLLDDDAPAETTEPVAGDRGESFWDTRKSVDRIGDADDPGTAETGTGPDRSDGATDPEMGAGAEILTGQVDPETGAGADALPGRERTDDPDIDIEAEPPDARLSDHLEHLQAELADDRTVARDLETLEAVAQEVEGDRTVPARCPQAHCDAVWTGRTVLGIGSGQYEVLDDGTRVQCLKCESIVTLE